MREPQLSNSPRSPRGETMKFFIRRLGFGIITAPIVVAVYASGYGLLAMLANQPTIPPADVMWVIGVVSILALVFAPQIAKLATWITK
jgi:hypothetical protein